MSSLSPENNFTFLPQGAIIQEFKVQGHNIVQSFSNTALYNNAPYFGETIGRMSNRIKGATINLLNGTSYRLAQNDGPNSLHGGHTGFGKRTFTGPEPLQRNGREAVRFTYVSPDGEEGYPGTIEVRVWYTAWEENDGGVTKICLEAEYEVEIVGDECDETVVGITNHSYFNLSGAPTVDGTEVTLSTNQHLLVDDTDIPIGQIGSYPGIEPDKAFTLGKLEPNVDHCFLVESEPSKVPLDTRSGPMKKLISMSHPVTQLHLEICSTEPAFQFYTGQFVNVAAAEGSPARPPRAGICVEPQRYINAINVPEWRSMVLLRRGHIWGARSVYKAWKA